jgi:hypothetical protein
MTDGEPLMLGPAEQDRAIIEEARLARVQAEEAVRRIQSRIERLVSLSTALNRSRDDDVGREPSAREWELAPPACRSA